MRKEPGENPDVVAGLGRVIRVLRAGQARKQQDLAKDAGISYPYLSAIEHGKKRPSSRALARIASVLGVRDWQLLEQATEWAEAQRPATTSGSPPSRWFAGAGEAPARRPPLDVPPSRHPARHMVVGSVRDQGPASPDETGLEEIVQRARKLPPDAFDRLLKMLDRLGP